MGANIPGKEELAVFDRLWEEFVENNKETVGNERATWLTSFVYKDEIHKRKEKNRSCLVAIGKHVTVSIPLDITNGLPEMENIEKNWKIFETKKYLPEIFRNGNGSDFMFSYNLQSLVMLQKLGAREFSVRMWVFTMSTFGFLWN